MFQRVLRGDGQTARLPLDFAPDAVTVTATRADGTVLVDEQVAQVEPFGASLALPALDALDVLSLTWTVTEGAEVSTHATVVEIVGGHAVTLAALRRADPLGDADEYPDEDLEDARAAAESALEDAAGVAFVPRHGYARLDGTGRCELLLPDPGVLRVRAVTVDGEALDQDALDALEVYGDEGIVYRADGWSQGRRNVVVQYEHGYRPVPGRVPEAVRQLVRHVLVDSPVDDRATSVTNEDGTVQVFVQPGVRGAIFAIPEANAVVRQYGVRGVV